MPGKLHLEDLPLTEQAPAHLIGLLEHRTQRLVDGLDVARRQLAASQAQQTLLEQKMQALEARRYELQEECRGLSEQNDELERHNRHLQARLEQSGTQQPLPHHRRQSKGLSALIGQSRTVAQVQAPDAKPEPAAAPQPAVNAEPAVKPEPVNAEPVKTEPVKAEPVKDEPAEAPAPSPQALLKEWYQRYDRAFFKGHTLPLKIGIHEDLAAAEPWPEKLVRRALACYVNLPRYLKAVRNGAQRIDLEGQPVGSVDKGAADHAQRKLEHLQAERRGSQGTSGSINKGAGADAGANKSVGKEKEAAKGGKPGQGGKNAADGAGKPRGNPRAKGTGARKPRSEHKPLPGNPRGHKRRQAGVEHGERREKDVLPDDPAERMQLKLDALMARHTKQ